MARLLLAVEPEWRERVLAYIPQYFYEVLAAKTQEEAYAYIQSDAPPKVVIVSLVKDFTFGVMLIHAIEDARLVCDIIVFCLDEHVENAQRLIEGCVSEVINLSQPSWEDRMQVHLNAFKLFLEDLAAVEVYRSERGPYLLTILEKTVALPSGPKRERLCRIRNEEQSASSTFLESCMSDVPQLLQILREFETYEFSHPLPQVTSK